ncbi:hypothetical protein RRG08_039217 [Elysia crispata]|uniref:Uncharacterized protein n=1 Tax=Elysia crispata TaxID=231223 RepID=A0AAE1E476_9GAST|nr:hypothetical protein RRG08_039217 [Elysia crispata]
MECRLLNSRNRGHTDSNLKNDLRLSWERYISNSRSGAIIDVAHTIFSKGVQISFILFIVTENSSCATEQRMIFSKISGPLPFSVDRVWHMQPPQWVLNFSEVDFPNLTCNKGQHFSKGGQTFLVTSAVCTSTSQVPLFMEQLLQQVRCVSVGPEKLKR